MSLQLPLIFESPSKPPYQIQYVHLNPSGQHTLLFCYGAGGSSTFLTLLHDFLKAHSKFAILCVDRWAQTPHLIPGTALLSYLSTLTIELLDHLAISKISIAAHSAGIYQALDLASRHPERTTGLLFPISTHIPAPFTASKIMAWMCTMPSFLFAAATSIDQLSDTKAERLWLRMIGSPKIERVDDGTFVDSKILRDVLKSYEPNAKQKLLQKEKLDLDYRLGYSRIPGIGNEDLVALYRSFKGELFWFTCHADVFYGPASVERIGQEMRSCKLEVALVEGACHSDIFLRSEVWEKIYERIVNNSKR